MSNNHGKKWLSLWCRSRETGDEWLVCHGECTEIEKLAENYHYVLNDDVRELYNIRFNNIVVIYPSNVKHVNILGATDTSALVEVVYPNGSRYSGYVLLKDIHVEDDKGRCVLDGRFNVK